MTDGESYREHGYLHVRGVFGEYRDPEDPPLLRDGVEEHVDWGQGMMVAGHNPVYWQRRPRFEIKPP
jgi:phytanoyl-CoA hydroxylase